MLKFKSNVLKIVMIMLIMCALLIPTMVFATDDVIEIKPTTVTPTPSATTTSTPTATATKTPSTTTKLPQTGIEDYTSLIVVTIVLTGSAIFAYIKIKEYNKF